MRAPHRPGWRQHIKAGGRGRPGESRGECSAPNSAPSAASPPVPLPVFTPVFRAPVAGGSGRRGERRGGGGGSPNPLRPSFDCLSTPRPPLTRHLFALSKPPASSSCSSADCRRRPKPPPSPPRPERAEAERGSGRRGSKAGECVRVRVWRRRCAFFEAAAAAACLPLRFEPRVKRGRGVCPAAWE